MCQNRQNDIWNIADAVWRGAAALVVSDGATSEGDGVPQTDGGATLMPKEKTVGQRVAQEGAGTVARQGLGEMPLTLWVIVAAVVLYFYIRRARLGIDQHPGEKPAPPAHVTPAPTVRPKVLITPTVPYRGGADVFTPN